MFASTKCEKATPCCRQKTKKGQFFLNKEEVLNKYNEGTIIMSDQCISVGDEDVVPPYFPLVVEHQHEKALLCKSVSVENIKVAVYYNKIDEQNFKSVDEYKEITETYAKKIGSAKRLKRLSIGYLIAYILLYAIVLLKSQISHFSAILLALSGFLVIVGFLFSLSDEKKANSKSAEIEMFCAAQLMCGVLTTEDCENIFRLMKSHYFTNGEEF